MASTCSFDISTGADLQEVDNAVNQTLKEIGQRYDFRGTACTVEFDREKATIRLFADDEFRMQLLIDVLETKCAKRQVPASNLDKGDFEPGATGAFERANEVDVGDAGVHMAADVDGHIDAFKAQLRSDFSQLWVGNFDHVLRMNAEHGGVAFGGQRAEPGRGRLRRLRRFRRFRRFLGHG